MALATGYACPLHQGICRGPGSDKGPGGDGVGVDACLHKDHAVTIPLKKGLLVGIDRDTPTTR